MTEDSSTSGEGRATRQVARYRKVPVATWDDPVFRELSPIPPCGQGLLLYLRTGPHTGIIPGLSRVGRGALADELGWELEAFGEAFAEVEARGFVKADFKARVVWLPGELKHNSPESPNVVRAWAKGAQLIPDCDLKREALAATRACLCTMGEAFARAWDEASAEPSVKPTPKPSRKASPNQQQQQQQQQQQKELLPASADAEPGAGPTAAKRAVKKEATSAATWQAYSSAFRRRYGADPLRDAKVNTLLCRIVASLGADEAPSVAAHYVGMSDRLYVEKKHPVNLLERDLQKVRTTWVAGSTGERAGYASKNYEAA